jgi:chloramphenicol 3-O-phosphotransferase
MKFRDFLLKEAKEKHAVLAFGRMNPPTTGHEVLVNKVKDVANQYGASHHVVLSHSQDKSKNPLSARQKLKHAQRFFPNTNLSVSNAESPNFLTQAAKLHKKGVTHLHMVAGSDRVPEYKQLLQKYNGTHEGALFNFKEIHVHSAGQRDPDAEGTEGMSASKMREHAKTGNFKEFKKGIPGHVKNDHAKELFADVRGSMGVREHLENQIPVDALFEEILTEGVHDKSIFKAVFLAGGPGSGKDYVLDNTLSGHGLVEINSDKALEFLMDKKGLDKTMPAGEQEERDIVRGKAKSMTELRQRLALLGRNGLIINGTGDDVEKIAKIKERLEEIGYDTHMVAVNTADEVSKQRNIERGTRGGRTVPEEIRKKKWDSVQAARPQFAEMFGQNYTEFDNSEDLRNAPPEVVKAKKDEMLELFKKVKEFTSAAPAHPKAQEWIANELHNKDTLAVGAKASEQPPHPESGASQEAQQLGLQYFGFGRYGKDGKVTHHSVNDKLVAITKVKPPEPTIPTSGSSGMKKVNEDFEQLFEAVSITISGDTVEEVKSAMKLLTSKEEPEEQQEQYQLSSSGAYNLLTLGQITEATSLDKFRAAAAEREKEYKKREAEMKARHAAGREDMSGAIDRLAQRLNKESTMTPAEERGGADKHYGRKYNNPHPAGSQEHQEYHKGYHGTDSEKDYGVSKGKPQHKFESVNEVSVNTLQSYRQKASQDAVHRAATGKGGSLDRFLNVQRAQDKIQKQTPKPNIQQTSMSESKENFVKDKNGKVRVFMLRRAAAKEAHQNGGVVHKQGAGYVIKLKENEDVTITNQSIQEETRSSTGVSSSGSTTTSISTGVLNEGYRSSCGEETSSNQGRQKITIGQAKKKLQEKVKESIDRGTEVGVSMSGGGENATRGGLSNSPKKKPLEELTGDETTLSIGAQKEDELKKQGINLSTFKAKKTV